MLRLFGSATMRLMPSSARQASCSGSPPARPRHLRTLLGEVVLQQLPHGRQALTQLAVGQLLRITHQLARQLIQLLRQRLGIGFAFIAEAAGAQAANKARVAQAQYRVDADDSVGQLFDMVQLKGVAVGVEKTAPGAHRAVVGQLALAAIMNAAQAIFPLTHSGVRWR